MEGAGGSYRCGWLEGRVGVRGVGVRLGFRVIGSKGLEGILVFVSWVVEMMVVVNIFSILFNLFDNFLEKVYYYL